MTALRGLADPDPNSEPKKRLEHLGRSDGSPQQVQGMEWHLGQPDA
jgi:hypothetical protein